MNEISKIALATLFFSGCFLSHGTDGAPEPEPEPGPPLFPPSADAGIPEPEPIEPGHDICPSEPDSPDVCACGRDRLPHPDAEGECFPCLPCPDDSCGVIDESVDGSERLFPEAWMAWQSPGGFAGHGPAVVVDGRGLVHTWIMQTGFDGAAMPAEPPDQTIELSALALDRLFVRWTSLPRAAIPHGPELASECYPSITVRLCDRCPIETIEYSNPAQLLPELECVATWFDDNRPGTEMRPIEYCSF